MARDHARILTAIWRDSDFLNLDPAAQHAYLTIVSQQRLTYCGVLDYLPSRLATLSRGNTEHKMRAAVKTLEKARFVVVDQQTHELLARSYVRHDGVMDRTNMGKAVARAFQSVVSRKIRDAILTELGRLYAEDQKAGKKRLGWGGFADIDPDAFDMASAMASTIPLPIASGGDR
jgi:hypothetical protein